ncbi:NAD(P)-dependent oxidoreductase [Streptomyces sp. NPDC057697]|uniref:NAD(P)-dependent oxidoreductase n=1 Tax=Streptomyces sp. NPDC057697 TaxID=3346219 RepID=UPI003696CA0F
MKAPDWHDPQVLVAHTAMAEELLPHLQPLVMAARATSLLDLSRSELAEIEVLIGHHFPARSLTLLPGLRWLHLTGSGTDHLPAAGLAPGTLVTNSARVPVESVAEYALSALLMLLKEFPTLSARPQRRPWHTSTATMLSGSTVLVVGAGRIGQSVIRRITALGARCVAVTRTGERDVPGADRTVGAGRLAEAAATADHMVCCLPATTGTHHLVNGDVLSALPTGAALVNVGRAGTVDDMALREALEAGTLRGALLDVHDTEPLPADDPRWHIPGLVISPHCAFAFPGEPAAVGQAFQDNLTDLRAGRAARDTVMVEIHSG